jgi:hypothetical protein
MSKADAPKNKHVATYFSVIGPSAEALTCAAFETDTGFELHLSYLDGHVMESQSFAAGPDLEERMAARANEWRRTWIEKGFRDVITRTAG